MFNLNYSKVFIVVTIFTLVLGIRSLLRFISSKCTVSDFDKYDKFVQVEGLKVSYKVVGNPSKPPMVFIHGWPMKFLGYAPISWEPLFDELSKHFYVIAMSPPGLFQSEPPNRFWTKEDHAEFLSKFLENFDINKPIIIMGQSYGGGIAATYAKLYPEQTKTLVLVDSATGNASANPYYKYFPVAHKLYNAVLSSGIVPFSMKRCIVHLVHTASPELLKQENMSKYGALVSKDISKVNVDYKSLEVPIMLVWGKDDELTLLKFAEKIHKEVKDSKLVVVEGTHTVLFQNPKLVVDAIISNLE